MFRLLDAVTTAHDLKRHMKVRPVGADSNVAAERVARQMRDHGVKMTGDDFLKRHFERRAQMPDLDRLDRAIAAEVASGQLLQDTATWFDAIAAAMASAPNGVKFRERLRGPELGLSPKNALRICGDGTARSAAALGIIYGGLALATIEIPPISALFGTSALIMDIYAYICG